MSCRYGQFLAKHKENIKKGYGWLLRRFPRLAKENEDPSELAHHGIKGQKWGVKNGPPYPLETG